MDHEHESRVIHVEIHGQRYPIRSALDTQYVAELAAFVDEKMRLAARECPAGDTLKIAVLAALNVADEYFRASDADEDQRANLKHRAIELERMVDLAIGLADPHSHTEGTGHGSHGSDAEQSNLDARLGLK
jgi:cell division protein ZapA